MDLIDKITILLKGKDYTQKGLAAFIGLTPSNLNTLLKRKENRKFSAEHIPLIATYFKVSVEELLGTKKTIDTKVIPLIGKASCGKPQNYNLNDYEQIPIPVSMYRNGMYAVEGDGDSMSPKINDGDIAFCDSNRQIDNGNIVHYWIDGESGIKKYKINEAGTIISLIPINSEYDIITIHCDENINLKMAKVVGSLDRNF